MFLCFFVSVACLASTFCVPYACQCELSPLPQERFVAMKDPASVGLQKCELDQRVGEDNIFIKSLNGDEVCFSVNKETKFVPYGVCIFYVASKDALLGELWFWSSKLGGSFHVEYGSKTMHSHDPGPFSMFPFLQKSFYAFGEESLTVKKCLGHNDEGDIFVSATIAYNDPRTVVIRCGKSGEGLTEGGVTVGTIFPGLFRQDSETCRVGTFSVPHTWESLTCLDADHVMRLQNPASLGLKVCDVRPGFYKDNIFIENLEGELLLCQISKEACSRGCIVSVTVNDNNVGALLLWNDSSGVHLNFERAALIKSSRNLGFLQKTETMKNLQYSVDGEKLTVRKCLGYNDEGNVFLSATIRHNDLKTVVFGFGKDREGLGRKIGTISANSYADIVKH